MCTLIFMAQFYLSGAALCWWIILMISWALAAIFKWSSESISQAAPFFHLFSWTFPAILTSTALYHRLVTGDAYLNSCILSSSAFSNWLLLFFPTVLFFFTGSAIFMAGLFALRNDLAPKTKSALLVHRIILFTIFFMLPKSAFLLVKFYEADNKAAWELAVLQGKFKTQFSISKNTLRIILATWIRFYSPRKTASYSSSFCSSCLGCE